MIRLISLILGVAALAPFAHAQGNWRIEGEWTGAYVCNQGLTALHISIRKNEHGDQLTAVFSFGPHKNNPGVPNGAYVMRGSFDEGQKRLQLRNEKWINQPPGYIMVDLDGLMRGSGLYISGDVVGDGCTHFDLHRDDGDLVG